MISNVRFAVIYVEDQQTILDFCVERLGFELLTDAPYDESSRWIEVGIPGAQTYLVIAKGDSRLREVVRERMGDMSHVWFDCDDLDATYADLTAKGVRFAVEPQQAPWDPSGNTRWAQFSDPEGALYGVTERGT